MSNISFNCDVCGRQVQGYTFVNGMKFCAKCYQETFGNINVMQMCADEIAGYLKKIADLEKQLAEKEKEISDYVVVVDDLHKQLSDKCDFCDKTHNQDKILFAVEQLEKVKELLAERSVKIISSVLYISTYDAQKTIDNQIKQLKEME